VTVFRPSVKVTGPEGREWEVYAYKINVGPRGYFESDLDDVPVGSATVAAELWFVGALVWIVMLVPRLVLRVGDVAVAAVRAAASDRWTIEAVTWLPHPERYAWSTTSEYKGQVLAQVEGHLARGDIPQHLTNATYLGLRRD
jgi:hypothetical protein